MLIVFIASHIYVYKTTHYNFIYIYISNNAYPSNVKLNNFNVLFATDFLTFMVNKNRSWSFLYKNDEELL